MLRKLYPSMAALVRIDGLVFIEPFALSNRADQDVAVDYSSYRAEQRDTLFRYFDECVVPKAPSQWRIGASWAHRVATRF